MKKILVNCLILSTILLSACSEKSTSTSSSGATHQYAYINGYCYDYTASAYVATTYCSTSTTTSTGYYSSNGYCYSSYNNQLVNNAYCSSTTGTSTATTCNGYYYYIQGQYAQVVYCNSYNNYCSGYTMVEYSTGKQVTCQ